MFCMCSSGQQPAAPGCGSEKTKSRPWLRLHRGMSTMALCACHALAMSARHPEATTRTSEFMADKCTPALCLDGKHQSQRHPGSLSCLQHAPPREQSR